MSPNAHAERHARADAELVADCRIAATMMAETGLLTEVPSWLAEVHTTAGIKAENMLTREPHNNVSTPARAGLVYDADLPFGH